MKRTLRWIKRLVLGLVALLVVAVAFVLIAVHTDWGRNVVREQAQAMVSKSFPGGATIGRIEGSPFGTLVISDLVINGADKLPLVIVKRIEAQVSLLPLLAGQVYVDQVLAKGVTVLNPRSPDPELLIPVEPSAFVIDLPVIRAFDVDVRIEGEAPVDLVFPTVLAGVHIDSGLGDLTALAWLDGTWTQRAAPIAGFANVVVGVTEVRIPAAAIGVGGANLVAMGGRVTPAAGKIGISASATSVARLAPGVVLPADAWIVVDANTSKATSVSITGALGAAHLHGRIVGDIGTLKAHGVVVASDIDLAIATRGAAVGHGGALLGFTVDAVEGLKGTIIATTGIVVAAKGAAAQGEQPLSVPSFNAVIAVEASLDRVKALVVATAAGRARVAVIGGAHFAPGATVGELVPVIDNAVLGATVPDLWAASGGLVPARGSVQLEAKANGQIGHSLAVEGWFNGRSIRVETLGIADVRGAFDATIGRTIAGEARVAASGITNAGKPVGNAKVTARTRADGRIGVVVNAVPAMAPVVANLSAIVAFPTPEGVIAIDLETHTIELPNGTWAGTGGTVRIDPAAIVVDGFRSASGDARLALSANIGRGTDVISGKVKASDIDLRRIDPKARGLLDIDLAVQRRGIAWKGGGTITAHGVAGDEEQLPLDGSVTLSVDGRRVKVAAKASNPSTGGAHLELVVDGPRDLTDLDAWGRVTRADLHGVTIGLDSLNARTLTSDRVPGIFDGEIEIREGVPDGKVRVRGIPTPFGAAGADIAVALDEVGFVDIKGDATVGDAGDVQFGARIQIPDRPFDIATYKKLGKNLVNGATLTTSEIAIDPAKLARFGIITDYKGTVVANVVVGTGGSSIDVGVDAKKVTGGVLRRPIDAHVGVRIDDKATTANLRIGTGATTLVEVVDAKTPMSIDRWLAWVETLTPGANIVLPAEPIEGTLRIPTLQAHSTLAIIGRDDVMGGTLAGEVIAGGTLAAPTAKATIDLANIAVKPRLSSGAKPPRLTKLHVDASWDGAVVKAAVAAEEAPGERAPDAKEAPKPGTLLVEAEGKPGDLSTLRAKIAIANFELSPVAVFLPGALVGARGKLDAKLAVNGLDSNVGTVRGFVAINEGRLPITAVLGTLRSLKGRIDLEDSGIKAKLDGIIGAKDSTVSLEATSDPVGLVTKIKASVRKLTPIGFLQPQISANATGTIERDGVVFRGDIRVRDGLVYIPKNRGNDLLDEVVPVDLIFIDAPEELAQTALRPPMKPWLILDVTVGTTRIELPAFVIPSLFGAPVLEDGKAIASGKVRISVGESIGMDGEILIDEGEIAVLGREYKIDLGQVAFDGTIDPLFDVKLMHEFPDVTTYVRFAGRVSEIDTLTPEFTSDPGTYAQSQLFGFFLGGTPGRETANQNQDALVGAGGAIGLGVITARLKRLGPLKLDTFRCDPSTTSAISSCVAGKYLRDNLFFGYQHRFAPRVDENSNEGNLEWTFWKRTSLELSGGDGGIFGADVLVRRRF